MPEPLGWMRQDETPEGFVSVLVLRHPDGISVEGALHQRHEAERALTTAGLDLFGATTGRGSAKDGAMGAVTGFWGADGRSEDADPA